jgi:hypothetical protein
MDMAVQPVDKEASKLNAMRRIEGYNLAYTVPYR